MKKLLIFGGAGYVGSHFLIAASAAGFDLLVADNLSTGHSLLCKNIPHQNCDMMDAASVDNLCADFMPDYVVHFAGLSLVAHAQKDPLLYHNINVGGSRHIIEACVRHKIGGLVFSSSAAVYGTQSDTLLSETHSTNPLNAYGQSKLKIESMLKEAHKAYGLNSIALRYFNAAGADYEAGIGEMHAQETHLIPNIFLSLENNNALQIFGDDFATPDGTAIRDYIHVKDLAQGHLQGIHYLKKKGGAHIINLGCGAGHSVREVIASCERASGAEIAYTIAPRRTGDPASLVADIHLANSALGFAPKYSALDNITKSAFHWHNSDTYRMWRTSLNT